MILEEDKIPLRLYCFNCDNCKCEISKYCECSSLDSKVGCTRKVAEIDAEKYYHYMKEVIPFWTINSNQSLIQEQYNEIISFLEKNIYRQDFLNIYNNKGKILYTKKQLEKRICNG